MSPILFHIFHVSLPSDVDFSSLLRFKHSIQRVSVYKFPIFNV